MHFSHLEVDHQWAKGSLLMVVEMHQRFPARNARAEARFLCTINTCKKPFTMLGMARSIFSVASSPRPHDRGVMFLQHRQIGMTDPGSQGPQIDTGDCRARTMRSTQVVNSHIFQSGFAASCSDRSDSVPGAAPLRPCPALCRHHGGWQAVYRPP
jgi:hypothetical protein